MGKKVRQFIDKKNAAVYHLMHRPSETGEPSADGADGTHTFVRTDTVRA